MRNPPRTLQNSIFEPLYQEELHFPSTMPNTEPSSLDNSFPIASSSTEATMKRAAATIFDIPGEDPTSDIMAARSNTAATTECAHRHRLPSTCDLGMCSPSGSSEAVTPTSIPIGPPIRSHSTGDVVSPDDGSVASKLLSSITKSISSPSLLACCKESARETPYQKSLRLRTMKLEFCAEELGSESSEGSLHGGDYFNNTFDSLNNMSSSPSIRDFSAEYQESEGNSAKLISVRSSSNLGCSSSVSKPTSHSKERSFPPPLSYTLPRSASLDSFSYSLRASREDGRFVLKEFKVPCRQYFQAHRKDGRLTLQCLTNTDEDLESLPTTNEAHTKQCRDLQEDDSIFGVYAGASGDVGAFNEAKDGSKDKVEVDSAKNTAILVGELELCGVKGSKKSVDDNDEKNDGKEAECLFAECLLMPKTVSNGDSANAKINDKAKFMSLGAANMKSDFKAAKRKTTSSKALRIRLSSNRQLHSSSSSRQSPLHLLGKSPGLKVDHDSDATKLTLESGISSEGGKALNGFEIAPMTSLQGSGYGIGKSPSSTITFKDVSAKCLMENESKLVASLYGLELYGGKWSCEEGKGLDKHSYKNNGGIMESTMHKEMKSINMRVREAISGCSHEAICGVLFNVKSREHSLFRGSKCDIVDESPRSCHSGASLHFGVEIPPPPPSGSLAALPLTLQGREWLHTLHCKEIFHRNLTKGTFMKLHCVA